ncbi:MAG: class I SAM-dependent methyltransferase [Ignavibacteriales bacterium]|nr:class I SAM-dependent methyltransferase [Ignavibacteriales bacterium]
MNGLKKNPASFRDIDGFIFEFEGSIYRAINECYIAAYTKVISSGLYEKLVKEELLIPHMEEKGFPITIPNHPLIIKPFQVKHISYPYEWSYEQLRDAALSILRIQEISLSYGFSLKDATPFNIQFVHGKPQLIDTLSFFLDDKNIWVAYKQFCESFLAPLALMAFIDHDIGRIGREYHNGMPLPLASTMLPCRTWLRPSLFVHLHLHARSQRSDKANPVAGSVSNPANQARLIFSLQNAVRSLPKSKSFLNWTSYYSGDCVHPLYLKNKIEIMEKALAEIKPQAVVDVGSNTGIFSKIASAHSEIVIALDRDPSSIEFLYSLTKKEKITNLIPLVIDILNPSPSLGWMSCERSSFLERINPDVILMLGISHHLLGQANITFPMLTDLCAKTTKYVFYEFIPDTDAKFEELFRSRVNQFSWYTQEELLKVFANLFTVKNRWKVEPTDRMIYLFEKKDVGKDE